MGVLTFERRVQRLITISCVSRTYMSRIACCNVVDLYTKCRHRGSVEICSEGRLCLTERAIFLHWDFHTYSAPVVFYVTFSVSDVRGKSGSKIRDPCMKLPTPRACA